MADIEVNFNILVVNGGEETETKNLRKDYTGSPEERVQAALKDNPRGLTPTQIMNCCGFPNTQKVASVVNGMDNVYKEVKEKIVIYKITYSIDYKKREEERQKKIRQQAEEAEKLRIEAENRKPIVAREQAEWEKKVAAINEKIKQEIEAEYAEIEAKRIADLKRAEEKKQQDIATFDNDISEKNNILEMTKKEKDNTLSLFFWKKNKMKKEIVSLETELVSLDQKRRDVEKDFEIAIKRIEEKAKNEKDKVIEYCKKNNPVPISPQEQEKKRQQEAELAMKRKLNPNYDFEIKIRSALSKGGLTPTELMAKVGLENTQQVAKIAGGMGDVEKNVRGKKVVYELKK